MSLCLFCDQPFTGDLDMRRLLLCRAKARLPACVHPAASSLRRSAPPLPQCGRQQDSGEICQDCQEVAAIYQGNFAQPGRILLQPGLHDLMVRYKRYGDYLLCQVLQELAAPAVQKLAADYYVPVPTSPEHRKAGL